MIAKKSLLKKLPLFVAVAACLYGNAVFAQDASTEAQDKKEEKASQEAGAKTLDKITVTGSLLKRLEYDTTSPVQVLTADVSADVGQVATSEFLQKSSVASGSTQISNQFAGFVVEGGTGVQTISLRGLGAQRTAVLLNGRRPGPAGTRGQVLAFDLNVIPQSILQRAEIVKDGASSIYGSDAVAGVVNLITRKNFNGPEVSVTGRVTQHGGAETMSVSLANGWNFSNGNIVGAVDYYLQEPLRYSARSYLGCAEDLVWDSAGNRIDRQDHSVTAGTNLAGCNNLYANSVIDYFNPNYRLVPSKDGSTVGALPGYHPRPYPTPSYANGGTAYYEDQLNFNAWESVQLINRQERVSAFASSDFSFGDVNWTSEFVFNERNTKTHNLRQFFPVVEAPVPSGYGQVIMPFASDQDITVRYYYLNTGLDGLIKSTDTWSWQANMSYSYSDGKYSNLNIDTSKTGDLTKSNSGSAVVDYFKPCIMNGDCMSDLVAAIGKWDTGHTVYDQFVFNASATGELFNLPAGAVGAAIGVEYRDFGIDDQPGTMSRNGTSWGMTSAQVTKGRDKVKEVFTEFEVPLLKGIPGIEALTFNGSARAFDYASVKDTDYVWKAGLSWQIIPSVRLRASKGTSYRAPGLYELYLGNQTGFFSQAQIDPCINWGDSNNDHLKANCAAAGIPDDYAAAGSSSATIYQGGGAGFLKPETSTAFTGGIVFTPTFAPISIAFDYFNYEVRDQISELSASTILGGCYASVSYPNSYCGMFKRNPGTGANPFMITDVYATYVNVNMQRVRGYDLLARFDKEFSFGKLEVEGQFTYTLEDVSFVFDDPESSGLSRYNNVGYIGRPELTGNLRIGLKRGDWNYTWSMDYVDETRNLDLSPTFTYNKWENAIRDVVAESRLYHTLSVRYDQPKWSLLFGINNVMDKAPPTVSSGVATRYGNTPAFATQYDLLGRTFFTRFNFKF